MSRISPKTTADRFRHTSTNCHPNIDGDMLLECANLYSNWRFDDLDDDNYPEGLYIGMPEEPEGYYVFISEKDKGPSAGMYAQNTLHVDIDEDFYTIDEPPVTGHTPASSVSASTLIAPPDAPELKKKARTNVGYKAGTYLIAYTWVAAKSKHTLISPYVSVVVGNGQFIRVTLPTSPPEGALGIGLWLSKVGGSYSSIRLQKTVSIKHTRPLSVLLKGPWKSGRKPPAKNETIKKAPKEPSVRKVPGGRRGKAGTYSASQSGFDPLTGRETTASGSSNSVTLSDREARNGGNLQLQNSSGSQNDQYRMYVNANGQDSVYTDRTKGSSAQRHRVTKKKRRRQRKRTSKKGSRRNQRTNGAFADEAATGQAGVLSSGSSSTTEDTGLENPGGELDAPAAEGPIYILGGKYWVGISYWVRGEETTISTIQSITITSTEVIRVHFPSPVDYFKNSQWLDLDSDLRPDQWELYNVNGTTNQGTFDIDEEGAMVLSTNGPKSPGSGGLTPQLAQKVNVDRDHFYTLAGNVDATMLAGTLVIELFEYRSDDTFIDAIPVKTVTTSGNVDFEVSVGQDQSIAFNDETASVQFWLYTTGATQNAVITINELAFHPHNGRLRRRILPQIGDRLPSDTNPPPHQRHYKRHHSSVELPPVKNRKPPSVAPLATLDFEDTLLPSGNGTSAWATRIFNGTSSNFTVANAANTRLDGARNLNIRKVETTSRQAYVWRSFGSNKNRLGVHFKFSAWDGTNNNQGLIIAQIRPNFLTSNAGVCAQILLYRNGSGIQELYMLAGDYNTAAWHYLGGVFNGDVLDIELIVRGAGTSKGYVSAALGRNGAQRKFISEKGPFNMSGRYANNVQLGAINAGTSAVSQYEFGWDSIVVTEYGDTLANPGVPAGNDALGLPDRPYASYASLDIQNFVASSVSSPWSLVTSGGTGVTTQVQAPAAIEGSFGLRVSDTGSSVASSGWVERTFATPRDAMGLKASIRVNTRPTTGSINVLRLDAANGTAMGRFVLSSTGTLSLQAVSAGVGGSLRTIQIGITNGSTIHIELVAYGANSTSGTLEAWVEVGGSGSVATRNLYYQEEGINWSGLQLAKVFVGVTSESTAAAQYSLDFDLVEVTERGQVLFSEVDLLGNAIYQITAWYHPGQPIRDDLWLQEFQTAVEPGVNYTFGIKGRHAAIPNTAYPYYFTAYSLDGTAYPLGSLYGSSGATGTMAWTDLQQTWLIPEDCYEVRMSSLQVGSGEFVCQELAVSRGSTLYREAIYPETGEFQFSLDTHVPKQLLAERPTNIWLRLDGLINDLEGTSGSVLFGSGDTNFTPDYWTEFSEIVAQKRFAHFKVTLNSDSTRRSSPIVLSDSPGSEVYTRNGDTQISCLLRDDMSEFAGGVFLDKVAFEKDISVWDQWSPKGYIRRHRRYSPVGAMKGFTINAFTEEAMREIEETSMSDEFVVESRDKRIYIKFSAPFEFDVKGATRRKHPGTGEYHVWGSADVETVEVLEVEELPKPWEE